MFLAVLICIAGLFIGYRKQKMNIAFGNIGILVLILWIGSPLGGLVSSIIGLITLLRAPAAQPVSR